MNLRAAVGGILLALSLALPARAADICVVTRPNDYGRIGLWEEHVMKMLLSLGIDFDTYRMGIPTAEMIDSLQVGAVQNGVGGSSGYTSFRHYKGLIFPGSVNGIPWAGGGGYGMDYFTHVNTSLAPPFVPMLWIADAHTGSSLSATSACSTGVSSQAVDAARDSVFLAYVPGTRYSWRAARAIMNLKLDYSASVHKLRPLVAYATARFTERPVADCQDCYVDGGYSADSLLAWEIDYRWNGGPVYEPQYGGGPVFEVKPSLYCQAGGPTDGTMMTLLVTLARLDSLTQGGVFRGARGRKMAVGIETAANLANDTWGSFPDDTAAFFPASMDSMDALGVPYTLQVSSTADTLERAYRWFARLRNARFASGGGEQVSPGKIPGAANLASFIPDYLGRDRVRHFWSGDVADTGSIACLLKADADLVRGKFGVSRFDPVVTFPRWPMEFQPGKPGPSADSVAAALAYARLTAAFLWWRWNNASSINEAGGGGLQIGAGREWRSTHPNVDFGGGQTRIRILSAGGGFEYPGRMLLGIDAGNFDQPTNLLSDDANDGGIRKYMPDLGLDVLMTGAGNFGSSAFNAGTPYKRRGYYHVKWFVNVIRATDAMCWPGNRCPLRIVSLSEMAGTNP